MDKGKAQYKHMDDEQVWEQHVFHDMKRYPIINFLKHLIEIKDQDNYFTDSKKGIQAKASLVVVRKEKLKVLYPNGRLKININTNDPNAIIIYHNMFHQNKNRPKQDFNPQLCDNILDENKNRPKKNFSGQDENKNRKKETLLVEDRHNGYRILKKGNDYVIEYILQKNSPYKSKRLYIHRMNNQDMQQNSTPLQPSGQLTA